MTDEQKLIERVDEISKTRDNNMTQQNEQGLDIVDRADKVAKELKIENDRREKLMQLEREMQARQILGGRAEAGQRMPEETETQKAAREASEILKRIR